MKNQLPEPEFDSAILHLDSKYSVWLFRQKSLFGRLTVRPIFAKFWPKISNFIDKFSEKRFRQIFDGPSVMTEFRRFSAEVF